MSSEFVESQVPLGPVMLIVIDSTFERTVVDLDAYMSKLNEIIVKREVTPITVVGKYGISKFKEDIVCLEVDDKNKTNFGQTLENFSNHFDEVLIITSGGYCNYLSMVNEVATDNNKTITRYGYPTK